MQVKTKNFMVAGLVVLLVGMLWYRVVYSSMESKASKAKTAALDADTQAKALRSELAGTASGSKTKTNDPDVAVMKDAIPDGAAEAAFLRTMNALLVSTGVSWSSLSPGVPVVSGNLATMSVGLSVQGSQAQVNSFVTGLGALKRLFVIDNISLAPGGSKSAAGTPSAAATDHGSPGNLFVGDAISASISGRIFSQTTAVAAAGSTATGSSGAATTPASSPASGATSPPGVSNN